MSAQSSLSPRERMFMAKQTLLEEEKLKYRTARRESRKLNHATSLHSEHNDEQPVASCSTPTRSESSTRPSSILRKSSLVPPSSFHEPPTTPGPSRTSAIPSSPAPSLPLPPAPMPPPNTDFGPPIYLSSPSAAASSSNSVRRRSSRVRFSDQQLQPNLNPNQALLVSRSTSLKSLRRESSIDGLRADLMQASTSLNSRKSSNTSQSFSRRISTASIGSSYHRDSFASSTNSDPFNWATSSFGSNHSDLDINSSIDIESRKQSLSLSGFPDLDSEIGLRILEEEEQGFKPQILPYPKISKELSRLSIESTSSSLWLTQDHMINQYPFADQDNNSIYSIRMDDESRKSSQFSLEAKIKSNLNTNNNSRKSSYSPSTTNEIPNSLRSSLSENEIIPNTMKSSISLDHVDEIQSNNSSISIMSISLPSKVAQTYAYSSLLPTRRRRSSLLSLSQSNGQKQEHLPNLNRGEWDDPELGLSPRSGPIRLLGSLSSMSGSKSRRGTKLAEEIIVQSSPELDYQEENHSSSPTVVRQDSIDLLSALPSPVKVTFKPDVGERHPVTKGHNRSDSTLSAIMAFPIPPDRIVEAVVPSHDIECQDDQDGTIEEISHIAKSLLMGEEEVPVNENTIELPLQANDSEMTLSLAVGPIEMVGLREISLNSPFMEDVPSGMVSQPMQIAFPISEKSDFIEQQIAKQPTEIMQTDELVMNVVPCPSSPELEDVLRTVSRPKCVRKVSEHDELVETDESDLDIASPLIKVAFESRILTPRSKLLSPSPSPRPSRPSSIRSVSANSIASVSSLRSGLGLTSGRGWSGSESEEEDWISTVKQIKARRSLTSSPKTPRLNGIKKGKNISDELRIQIELEVEEDEETPTIDKIKRFSSSSVNSINSNNSNSSSSIGKKSKLNRYSQLSEISTSTTTTIETIESNLPLTPSIIELSRTNSNSSSIKSELINQPGNFPWRLSSPPNSPIRGLFVNNLSPTREFFTSFRNESRSNSGSNTPISHSNNKRSSSSSSSIKKRELPKPKLEIECWGEPEILIDEFDFNQNDLDLNDDEDLYPNSDIENDIKFESKILSLKSSISSLSLNSDLSVLGERCPIGSSRRSTIKSIPSTDKIDESQRERSESPELWMEGEGELSLMDEEMPEM